MSKNRLRIYSDISLKGLNTFGLEARAKRLAEFSSEDEAIEFLGSSDDGIRNYFVLGGGSNLLFTGPFEGTILKPSILEMRVEQESESHAIVSAGAGVNWDKFVEWCMENGFYGLENLSLIPGTVGASPVQNIGAYGVEASDRIEMVRCVSISHATVREFSNSECAFGYRKSLFKNEEKGRYLVTRVYFRLSLSPTVNIRYGSLAEEVNRLGQPTPDNLRKAVINIRRSKLPDPEVIGNAGSFFKNPVVAASTASKLREEFPGLVMFEDPEGMKLAAGWLIEQCGWKGKREGNVGVYEKQALILVNYGNASGIEIFELSEKIRSSVRRKFGVELEREVEIAGSI